MDDVAAHCGIAKSTVSRALSRPEKVSPATRLRVEEAVRELGYLYNPWASSPGKSRREFLGVMVSQLREITYNETLTVIDNMASAAKYEVLFAVTHEAPQREEEIILRFKQYRASAIIVLGATMGTEALLRQARAEGIPNLMLWETSSQPGVNFIGIDNRELSAKATCELLRLGHQHIAILLGGSENLKRAQERERGYRESLEQAGRVFDPQLVQFLGPLTQATGQSLAAACQTVTRNLLGLPHPPTAFLVPNGLMAVTVMTTVQRAGLRVPEDISVLCIGEDALAISMLPALSAMETSASEMHLELSLFLQQVFRGESAIELRHTLPTNFRSRESCLPHAR